MHTLAAPCDPPICYVNHHPGHKRLQELCDAGSLRRAVNDGAFGPEALEECAPAADHATRGRAMSAPVNSVGEVEGGDGSGGPDRWALLLGILQDIAAAMEYIHSKRLCHGDLNPANILLKARR